jgi:hypothetical protein
MTNQEKDDLIEKVKALAIKHNIKMVLAKAPTYYPLQDDLSDGIHVPYSRNYYRRIIKEDDAGSGSTERSE